MNGLHEHHGGSAMPHDEMNDPVCGMTVQPDSSHHFEYRSTDYRFCSAKCRDKFAADPERYLHPYVAVPSKPATEYTCPMHPEVVRSEQGNCPICGMAAGDRHGLARRQAGLSPRIGRHVLADNHEAKEVAPHDAGWA